MIPYQNVLEKIQIHLLSFQQKTFVSSLSVHKLTSTNFFNNNFMDLTRTFLVTDIQNLD